MGWELIVETGVWCEEDSCPHPNLASGPYAEVIAGEGSIWRCDKCRRGWTLIERFKIGTYWEPIEA